MQVQVARWGNSLGVRIPKDIAGEVGLSEGARVEIAADQDRIVITVARPRYRLDDLLVGMTPEAVRDAFEWGADVGREAVTNE
jgi:antitoxin MazE